MINRPRPAAAVLGPRAAIAPMLLAASTLALASCGQHAAYPGSSAPPPPPPPQADLMGAPEGVPPTPPPGPPQAYAPAEPGLEAPAQPTVERPYGDQTGPDGSYRPGYDAQQAYAPSPARSFPPGECPPRGERLATDGCMDPIANPPEDQPVYRHRAYAPHYAEAYTPAPRHHRRRYVYGAAPYRYEAQASRRSYGLYRYVPYRPAHHPRHTLVVVPVPVGSVAHHVAHHVAKAPASKPVAHAHTKTTVSSHAEGAKPATPTLKAPAAPDTATTAGAAGLAAALTPVVKARAALHVDGLSAGRPGDVTLTLPPDFADGLRAQAKKNGLADAAASANLTAQLTGDGYTVIPADPQSQPLTAGQATTFKWTVTPQPNARGPLRAQVGADLLGGGVQHVDLGTVQQAAGAPYKLSAQAVGWILLGAIALVLAGLFLARGRRPPPPTGAIRPRANNITVGPPFSLDETRR